jgi:hypothetical protein
MPTQKPAGQSYGETSRDAGMKPNPNLAALTQQHENQMGMPIPQPKKTK